MSASEYVVCSVDELKDGEMKEVELEKSRRKALVVRDGKNYYAIGAKCSHFGASLKTGVLCNGRVRCPWHGACFNIKTGDIEDFPGLDSIPKYEVFIKDGKIIVKDDETTPGFKRVKPMVKASSDNKQIFVLIGGGPASVNCAQTLRQEGFTGKVVLVTDEQCLPYDRTKLSKAMTSKAEQIALKDEEFYKSGDIEIMTGKEVVRVDSKNKSVTFKDGGSLKYTSLLIGTGGKPRVLPIPGIDLENVCLLRTPSEANKIAADAAGKNVVILGSSFIGMEVASCVVNKAQSVSVVDLIKIPFQLVLGEKVGSALCKLHEDKGVKFYFENSIQEFVGENGKVKEVILKDGTRLPADICVLGTGVVPATDFLKDSGINLTSRGFITVDKCLKTNVDGVFAVGDIVEFPLFMVGDAVSNVQHWQMATMHGRVAAFNMNGKKSELHSVPYFWTQQYGKSIRYAGYGAGFDDVVIHGDLDALKFAAFYTKGDSVVAVATMGMDPLVSQAAELMNLDQVIKKSEIKDDPQSWVHRLKPVSSHM